MNKIKLAATAILTALLVLAVPAVSHAAPVVSGTSKVSTNPVNRFGSFNGTDVATLNHFALRGRNYITVGGDVTSYVKGSTTHTVRRIAILDESTGDQVWTNSVTPNGWVHVITPASVDSATVDLFVGGTFTSIDGQARSHVAKYRVTSPSVGHLSVSLTSWNPAVKGIVRGIATSTSLAYVAAGDALYGVDRTSATQRWRVGANCGVIAVLYHSGSVYAGGISRVWNGTYTSLGPIKVASSTGKIDTKFKAASKANTKPCTDPTATPTDIIHGSNALSMTWNSVNNWLVVGEGGKKNIMREFDPATGAQKKYHNFEGDCQTVLALNSIKELFVGFHRSGNALIPPYRDIDDAMGTFLNISTAVQLKWKPSPDFVGSETPTPDNRNNGIIASTAVDSLVLMGGAFTSGGGEPGHVRLIAFPY